MDVKEKVLLIEDDPGIVKFIKATLSANNYDVLAAKTGAAVRMASSRHSRRANHILKFRIFLSLSLLSRALSRIFHSEFR